MDNGCNGYIGAIDYIDGSSSFFFVVRFFYELTTNKKSIGEAFELASSTDEELRLYRLYK